MITVKDIPILWRAELDDIRKVCPTAVLAGGALRDLDNKREVKDLDVFIYTKTESDMHHAIEQLNSIPGYDIVHDSDSALTYYPEDQNLEVVGVTDGPVVDGYELQFIFTNWDTNRITDRFDYGICRLAYDGESLLIGEGYEEDKGAEIFKLRRSRPTPISMRGSVKRYARLTAEKYSGWDWWDWEPEVVDAPPF